MNQPPAFTAPRRLYVLLLLLLFAASLRAQTGTGLKGEYFNNMTLTGVPALTRTDATVSFNWGGNSPDPSLPIDGFSVRWTGQVQPQYSETYTFYANTDDGVRMWVNGVPIFNDWTNHPAQEFSGTVTLLAGQKYDITMEFFENGGDAVAELRWSSPSTPKAIIPQNRLYPAAAPSGTGLKGDYFNNMTVTGSPVLTRTDAMVNFQWNGTSPGAPVAASNFSARWCGRVQPQYSETYTFYTNSDDGVRLWVNGVQIINNWTDHAPTENSGTIALGAGQSYTIAMEYYQGGGGSVAELRWSSPSTPKALIPQARLYPAGAPNGIGLAAQYFANDSLSGAATLSRTDGTVDFVWPGAPASGLPSDHFSVYWSGQVQPQYSETYTFYTHADDGVRLWVNGVLLIDDWNAHPPVENSGTVQLVGGQKYNLELEFFENEYGAEVQLSWSSPSQAKQIVPQVRLYPTMAVPTGNGLKGEYYNSTNLSGAPVLTRTDSTVDFNWGTASPGAGVNADGFSVGWSGQIEVPFTDTYTFYALADDGVRLWVNGVQIIDDWGSERSGQERQGNTTMSLNVGQRYDIVMETYDGGGGASARLSWSSPSVTKQVIPMTRLFSASSNNPPAQPVPVGNFSFETPSLGLGNFEYNTTGGSWNFSAAGIAANGSGFTGSNPGAPNGTQVAFLQGIGGNMSQSVSNFAANVPYTLTFAAAERNYGQSAQAWQVKLDGSVIGTFAPPQTATSYTDYSTQFSLSSPGTYVLEFQNLNSGDSTVFIDNIRITPTSGGGTAPAAPGSLSASAVSSSQVNLAWSDNSSNETGFKIERKTGAGGMYAQIATPGANATSFQDAGLAASTTYYYRVRATNAVGDSAYSNEASTTTTAAGDPKLTGTIIGTNGSYNNDPSVTKDKAMDGSLTTYFDASTGDGNWVGIDLGPTAFKVVTKVRFAPRVGWAGRMVSGKFQGSNDATFATGVVDLFTISAAPPEGSYTQQTITNTNGFRYVRYLSPTGGFGNCSEIEFYGHDGSMSAPSAPSALVATSASSSQINLTWTDNSSNETSFKIERKTGASGTYAQIGTTGANGNSFSDGGLSASTQYYYRVRANNIGGDSAYSNEANATTSAAPPATPAAPSNLAATPVSNTQINLAWTDNATNETGFKIERKTGAGGTYAQIATASANVTSYSNTGLTAGTTYYYQVRANNGAGDSGYSNEATATTTGGTQPDLPLLDRVGYDKITLTDNFWAPRILSNRTVSLPMMYQSFVDNHNLDNFPKTAGFMAGNQDGFPWADSDVYKTLEGMVYAIKLQPDSSLQQKLDSVIPNIAAAQRSDGYLDTYIQLGLAGRGGGNGVQPWQDMINLHEDYCMGHMIEAAVAHYQATGLTNFLTVARNAANHLYNHFGPSPKASGVPGHQEVELALMRLYDSAQGQPSDLDIAKFYIDERGRHSGGRGIFGEYCQDLREVRVEDEPLGHGVRGPYMWAGAVDVARATNDTSLLTQMETMWQNVVDKKMYVTGGMDHRMYNEGFAPDYDLPNDQAYNETCASCAMMMFTHRLGNARGDGKYPDLIERILYNTFAASRNLSGSRLYYNEFMSRNGTAGRQGIVCCATNIVRTIPSLQGYEYSIKGGDGIWVNQFMAGTANLTYGSTSVTLVQASNYPWDGAIQLNMNPQTATAFTLHVRIPAWVTGATCTVNGASVSMAGVVKGYLPITRTWQSGDVVLLNLPMPVRRIYAHSKVWADQGRVAFARGPIIYCLESPYNSISVHRIVIPTTATVSAGSYNANDLGGIVRLTGTGINADGGGAVGFTLIPYAVWDNADTNNNSSMCVWIPETTATANNNAPDQGRLANATVTYSYKNAGDSAAAINDGLLGTSSNDQSIPRFTWWSHLGTAEWIAYEFPQPLTLWRSDIMWFDDGGGCGIPQSYNLEYWNGATGQWAPVQLTADYMHAADQFSGGHPSVVRFTPVTTTKIRCNVQLQSGKSGGVLEWRLPE